MAAPASKTVRDLNGKWVLNKALSDSVDPALTLQGVSWLVRKAIGAASVTLHVKQYQGAPRAAVETEPAAAEDEVATHIDIEQAVGGAGLKGTTEHRCLDNRFREHADWLFGRVRGRSRHLSLAELRALAAGEARDRGWVEDDAVARDWLPDDGPDGDADAATTLVLSFVESLDSDWTALQAWGFQDVGGERRYVRNLVVAKKGQFYSFKMVYDWAPE
ncbi:hypothetical protein GGS23DRAFT_593810 [Durotheca rogersii]|uniref:uncharacterized protein n=1 Tax=Durotheca rogersii TaxID=419775 RepID=UPI00221F8586|nr:uncharacterized protein GGS23DRAFT_593810 [Durotheca rogersii]KAI5867078.1 hypothetical protein GGS23DRAFT_593810 [Durotheca rogersii]